MSSDLQTLPPVVFLGDTRYEIVEVAETAEVDGEYHASSQTIGIRPGLRRSYERYILAHEVVHGLFEHAGAAPEGDERFTEEQVACIIGRALPALLRNNPKLVEYLSHE